MRGLVAFARFVKMKKEKIASHFPNPDYPTGSGRNCAIADFKNGRSPEAEPVLAGRLLEWRQNPKGRILAKLTDATGVVEVVLPEDRFSPNDLPPPAVNVGDIVEIQFEKRGGEFQPQTVRRLVPFRFEKGRSDKNRPNWKRAVFSSEQRRLFQKRSHLIQKIRRFFLDRGFLEMDAPTLVSAPGPEPHLEPFRTSYRTERKTLYLQTSPEFTLKKWLTAGFEKIFYLGHSFRDEPRSRWHQPEFLMLEWYRAYADYTALMRDCEALLRFLAEEAQGTQTVEFAGRLLNWGSRFERISVADALKRTAGIDLASVSNVKNFVETARQKGYRGVDASWNWDDIFFEIFLNEIEPKLGYPVPTFLTEYPVSMGALAHRIEERPEFVERFELYAAGIELANAFTELNDPEEQRERFQESRAVRRKMGKRPFAVDTEFLDALKMGMPPAAGIALGVDRLLMILLNQNTLSDIQF